MQREQVKARKVHYLILLGPSRLKENHLASRLVSVPPFKITDAQVEATCGTIPAIATIDLFLKRQDAHCEMCQWAYYIHDSIPALQTILPK